MYLLPISVVIKRAKDLVVAILFYNEPNGPKFL